jgi:hypothetical protein
MKITSEILKSMGFTSKSEGSYELMLMGYKIQADRDQAFAGWTFCCNGETYHSVTNVAELIAFAIGDGYDSGIKDCKKQFRNFLEIS